MRPHTTETPARGSKRRERIAGSSVVTLASAKVRSPVRCGREVCPPVPSRRTSTWSAALVIGPSRRPTWPTSTPGSQCSAKTRSTSSRRPSPIRRSGSPGHHLLGRLEEQPHPAGQQALGVHPGERRRGADERRGVHVVAAGVRDARHGADPRVAGRLLHRQRVEVGAQPHDRAGAALAQVGDEPGARRAARPASPAPPRRSATTAVVRVSCHDSSGWACRSRRSATSASAPASTSSRTRSWRRASRAASSWASVGISPRLVERRPTLSPAGSCAPCRPGVWPGSPPDQHVGRGPQSAAGDLEVAGHRPPCARSWPWTTRPRSARSGS